uniref:Uncharacterized protein n=1 Tax=Nothoprocta perdicaria TaxID=30464 RepID=A0A8C6ZUR1_NOTPE
MVQALHLRRFWLKMLHLSCTPALTPLRRDTWLPQLFENALKYHSGEPVSGILLLYSSCALHVIEVSHPKPFGDGGEIKVLVVSHNIPSRLFPDWYVTTVTPSVTYLQDTTQAQSTEEVLTECLVLLFKLAAYVPKTFEQPADVDDLNNDLHTLAPELIIPAETVNYLCDTEEFSSPEEFLKMYLNPLQPAMDSGTLPTVLETKINLRHRTRSLFHMLSSELVQQQRKSVYICYQGSSSYLGMSKINNPDSQRYLKLQRTGGGD